MSGQKPYEGKDGAARVLARMIYEAKQMLAVMGECVKDLVTFQGGPKKILSNFVDIFVEGIRIAPYFLGHVAAYYAVYKIAEGVAWMVRLYG